MIGEVFDNFISIEGGDGSGKATQAKLLGEHATALGLNVKMMSYPQYDKPTGKIVGNYLDGQYGEANSVHADLASLPYSLDRYEGSFETRAHLALPDSFVGTDRYVLSNLAHQGTKFEHKDDRLAFYDRILQLEFGLLNIPRPRINILLLVPVDLAQLNVDSKDASTRSYTDRKRDVHEADPLHLERAKANYEELALLYPDEIISLRSTDRDGNMRSRESVAKDIRAIANLGS